MSREINNGGRTSYYDIPPNATTLNDLIEFKHLTPNLHEIMKASYALRERSIKSDIFNPLREFNKMQYYLNREQALVKNWLTELESTERVIHVILSNLGELDSGYNITTTQLTKLNIIVQQYGEYKGNIYAVDLKYLEIPSFWVSLDINGQVYLYRTA